MCERGGQRLKHRRRVRRKQLDDGELDADLRQRGS